jgi:ATP-dependent Clp protease adapter protein ClpS
VAEFQGVELNSAGDGGQTPPLHCPICGTSQFCDECVGICTAIIPDSSNRLTPMPSFSQNLDQSLQRALVIAEQRSHQQATDGHLLLALTDDPDAAAVMHACKVDLERLRRAISLCLTAADQSRPADGTGPASSPAFRTVVQSAVVHAQSIGSDRVVTGADVLAQMFIEGDAAELLREHGMTRYDVTRYISHRIPRDDRPLQGGAGDEGSGPRPGADRPAGQLAEVRLLNDDYTPMEFVVHVLERMFDQDQETAVRIMLEIHETGVGTCGVYPRDAADAKVTEVLSFAREHQHPLHCVLVPSSSA